MTTVTARVAVTSARCRHTRHVVRRPPVPRDGGCRSIETPATLAIHVPKSTILTMLEQIVSVLGAVAWCLSLVGILLVAVNLLVAGE